MQTFYFTDPGKVRSHNEDSVIILNNENKDFVLAIADGMGGHKAGEVASSIAIEHITESFEQLEKIGNKEDAIDWLRLIVKEINDKIFAYAKKHPESKGLGTTLVIAIKTEDYILYGNIGDSSGYVIKNNILHKVTKDHTYVGMLVSNGKISEETAKTHPGRNLLTRALTDLLIALSSLEITAFPKSTIPNIIKTKGITIFIITTTYPSNCQMFAVSEQNPPNNIKNLLSYLNFI